MAVKNNIKIGFDISQTGKSKSGCGYFANSLLKAAQANVPFLEWQLFPHFGDFYHDNLMPNSNFYLKGNYGPVFKSRSQSQKYWNAPRLDFIEDELDILHSNNYWCPFQLKKTKLIYTLYDLGFIHSHEWTTEANRLGCFDGVFKAANYADGIIAISEYSKQNFLQLFPKYPEERMEVIYPCSRFNDIQLIKTKPTRFDFLESQKFWLSVGTIEPRKNQKFLIDVYLEYIKKIREPFKLVFAGQKGWMMEDFSEYIQKLGLKDKVFILGYVNDNELSWLYQNCFGNLYPSHFEGFGLPILEGLLFRAPTIFSNTSSMPEIMKDGITLSPIDKKTWVHMMQELQVNTDFKKKIVHQAGLAVQNFGWDKSALKLGSFYKKIYNLNKI